MEPDARTILDYALEPRGRGRRRILIGAVAVVMAAAIVFAWRHVEVLKQRWQWVRIERQCMNYRAAPEQVVFLDCLLMEDKSAGEELLASHVDYRKFYRDGRRRPSKVGRVYGGREALLALHGQQGGGTTIFCHWRRTPGGDRRLVIVSFDKIWIDGHFPGINTNLQRAYQFQVSVFQPVGFFGSPTPPTSSTHTLGWIDATRQPAKLVQFFAGQPDREEESHFVIPYEVGGVRGHIDGWLNADGQSVTLMPRDGPIDRSRLGHRWR